MIHNNHNQTCTCFPTDTIATWSTITDNGSDWQLPPKLNCYLNRLLPNGEIYDNFNEHAYTIRKVDPYTATATNDITGQQQTLKSSVCVLNIFAL